VAEGLRSTKNDHIEDVGVRTERRQWKRNEHGNGARQLLTIAPQVDIHISLLMDAYAPVAHIRFRHG
jgi:hypothetical protein